MTTNDKEMGNYIRSEKDKELAGHKANLKSWVQQEIQKKNFVGTPQMQQEAYQSELNRLNNDAQVKLMEIEQKLDLLYDGQSIESKNTADKSFDQKDDQSATAKESKLDKASFDFDKNWKKASDPKKDIDFDR